METCHTYCKNLTAIKKSVTTPNSCKTLFLDHKASHHTNSLHIYTDGPKSCDDVGFAAVTTSVVVRRINECSGYSAQLFAILHALKCIINVDNNHSKFAIFSDSRSRQLSFIIATTQLLAKSKRG